MKDLENKEHASRSTGAGGRIARAARSLWAMVCLHRGKVLVGAVVVAIPGYFVFDELGSSRVPRGVHVLGADLSRASVEDAVAILSRAAAARLHKAMRIQVGDRLESLQPIESGLSIDVAETAARAIRVARGRGVSERFAHWLKRHFSPVVIPPTVRADPKKLDASLDRIESRTLELGSPGGMRLDGERFVPVPPRAGVRLQRPLVKSALLKALEDGQEHVLFATEAAPASASGAAIARLAERAAEVTRERVVLVDADSTRQLTLEPKELRQVLTLGASTRAASNPELQVDPAALETIIAPRRAELETEAISARFVIDPKDQVRIVPSEPDARVVGPLLADAVLAALFSPTRRGTLPLVRRGQPPLTTEGARALGVRNLLSTFTTRHACCEKRVENIHRIADLLDGLLIKPGETVSVNAVVGPRTLENGFVPAPAIEEGEMVDSVGGGISQFATTLFNALFYGGVDIVERQPHSYWFSRYPMGHEATLSYPKPDLIFRNDTDAGMVIDTLYTKTSITVRIFGDNAGRKVIAEVSPRQNLVEPPVELVGNSEIAPDEEHVKEAGTVGWTVEVGRIITFADGKKKEERRKVTYRPKPKKVEVHPCRVPKGEKSYTGERCPEPDDSAEIAALPVDE